LTAAWIRPIPSAHPAGHLYQGNGVEEKSIQ
jgi:hypothetical protein